MTAELADKVGLTTYQLLLPGDAAAPELAVEWPAVPGYRRIAELVEPLLGDEPLEHVSVLYQGEHRDMFVSELGHLELTTRRPLPRNDRATAIYRAAWMARHPWTKPETLQWIAGPAVLFLNRRVWV